MALTNSSFRRLWSWCRQHPKISAPIAAVIAAIVVVSAATGGGKSKHQAEGSTLNTPPASASATLVPATEAPSIARSTSAPKAGPPAAVTSPRRAVAASTVPHSAIAKSPASKPTTRKPAAATPKPATHKPTAPANRAVARPSPKAPAVTVFQNCAALNEVYPHGVGRPGAVDRTSGTPDTKFVRNAAVYRANAGSDGDGDYIACEKA